MGENEISRPLNLDSGEISEIDFRNRDKVIECIKNIRQNFQKISHLLGEFKGTNDLKKQALIKTKISIALESLNGDVSRGNSVLGLMRKDIDERARVNNDFKYQDSKLRIIHTATIALQNKMYEAVKDLSKLQMQIKDTYKEKMSRQLQVYDPNLAEETLNDLVNDPAVG
jgi:t-SNARE complex subunit (syntaxin)